MIYFGASVSTTGLGWIGFEGASGEPADSDLVLVFRGNDPAVLEQQINEAGVIQSRDNGRNLGGIQIAGTGKGREFTVHVLFTRYSVPPENNFPQIPAVAGLNIFLFSGEGEVELMNRKEDALSRARDFCVGFGTPEWRGLEIAGSCDGRTAMGLFVVHRGSPV